VGKRWPRRLSECEPAHLETDGGVYMEWKLPCTVTRNADGTGSLLKKSGDTKPGDQTERNRRRYSSEYCFSHAVIVPSVARICWPNLHHQQDLSRCDHQILTRTLPPGSLSPNLIHMQYVRLGQTHA
jgi:hypothetical protein